MRHTPPRRQRGFTLLEIILVMLLMAFAVSAVVLSVSGTSEEKQLQQQAKRFAAVLQYAQEQALLSGYDLGIHTTEQGYQFVRLEKLRWTRFEDQVFKQVELQSPQYLELELDGFQEDRGNVNLGIAQNSLFEQDFVEEEVKHELVPQIYVLSSGDVTPFKLMFRLEELESYFALQSDELGNLSISKVDDE